VSIARAGREEAQSLPSSLNGVKPRPSAPTVKARVLAFYLPQFHPIPENDRWWGPGFTEWTNVVKARPLFKGHYQPRLPGDLGFYDLRVPEVREAQAELARGAGIEGFVYYHYWFGGGKRLLERPFNEVVASGRPDLPFCVCWANQTWSGIWHGAPNRILIEQTYPGDADNECHFMALLDAFRDERYIRVDGRPVFVIYRPGDVPNRQRFLDKWRELAVKNGLPGLYFVAHLLPDEGNWDYRRQGFDGAVVANNLKAHMCGAKEIFRRRLIERSTVALSVRGRVEPYIAYLRDRVTRRVTQLSGGFTNIVRYEDALLFFMDGDERDSDLYPCVIPDWDNTARAGFRGVVLDGSTPELFSIQLRRAISRVAPRPSEHRIVFLKSWNEWAEGNYLEPDVKFGREYLRVVREAVVRNETA